jgi:hypothetical protein
MLEEWSGMVWTEFVRLRIVASGRFFFSNTVMSLWVAGNV